MPAKTATPEEKFRMGRTVEQLRLSKGLTISEPATLLDVDKAAISRLESGQNYLSWNLAMRMAKVFGITCDELYQKGHEDA